MPCGCCYNYGWHEEGCEENLVQKLKEVMEEHTEEDS